MMTALLGYLIFKPKPDEQLLQTKQTIPRSISTSSNFIAAIFISWVVVEAFKMLWLSKKLMNSGIQK